MSTPASAAPEQPPTTVAPGRTLTRRVSQDFTPRTVASRTISRSDSMGGGGGTVTDFARSRTLPAASLGSSTEAHPSYHRYSSAGPLSAAAGGGKNSRKFMIALDVFESAKSYTIVADLPGVAPSDIKITVKDHVLNLFAERPPLKLQQDSDDGDGDGGDKESVVQHRAERPSGVFLRSMALPFNADGESISAKHRHGVLSLTVGKKAATEARVIAVDAKDEES